MVAAVASLSAAVSSTLVNMAYKERDLSWQKKRKLAGAHLGHFEVLLESGALHILAGPHLLNLLDRLLLRLIASFHLGQESLSPRVRQHVHGD